MEDILYDTQTLEAMERFHRVWSRVSSPMPTTQSEPFSLRKLLADLRLLHRSYSALMKHFPGYNPLVQMTRETAHYCRLVQAELYVREGQLLPATQQALPRNKRSLLRNTILLEEELLDLCSGRTNPEFLQKIITGATARAEAARKLLATCFQT